MHILITGGTGFLGGRLIPQLARNGHQVFALTRSSASHAKLRALGASPVDADLESTAPLSLPAVDAVVHAAALFRFSGPREPFFHTNVDGTARLLVSAENAGARIFVHISAAGIIMDDAGTPMMPVRPSAMPMSAHRHFRTTSRLTWQARHGLKRSYWRPTSRPSAPLLFGRRHSGDPATHSAGRYPRQSTPGSSPSSTVVTMSLTPATSTMSSKLFNAPWSAVRVVTPCSSPTKRN